MSRILVIDDESNIRMMVKLALTHVGYDVETAADGYEGLERFGDGAGWNLVLLDQRMPGMEGLDVLREMRRRTPDARILMITAFGTIDLATEAMTAGAADFLRKPFTVETLRSAVSAALAGQPDGNAAGADVTPIPYSFDATTVNGFRLRSTPGVTAVADGGISDTFTVVATNGVEQDCRVDLPCYVIELVKAHADLEGLPGGERFWQALCGEALANYLWQNAAFPENGILIVDDLTSGLRHWID
ncbi:MAG: response regulator, partial [Armatimonadota bacterium]